MERTDMPTFIPKIFAVPVILLFSLTACQTTAVKEATVSKPLPPMERPDYWTVGSTFVSVGDDGKEWKSEVIAADETTYTWQDQEGCTWVRAKDQPFAAWKSWKGCSSPDGSHEIKRLEDTPIFPLKVRNQWSYSRKGTNVKGQSWETVRKCSVPGEARVTTKLGSFDTFKVTCEDDWNRYTWYVAPANKQVVIYERYQKRQNSTETYETVSFTKR
tara:strand:- start:281 stop:928 length:648 start_codon:yes stop_codon:yes gene_type:complete